MKTTLVTNPDMKVNELEQQLTKLEDRKDKDMAHSIVDKTEGKEPNHMVLSVEELHDLREKTQIMLANQIPVLGPQERAQQE